MWTNVGLLPFWLMLIVIPKSKVTQIFINSVILPLVLSALYVYIIYQVLANGENLIENFNLFLGIENLNLVFSNDNLLLIFWLHYLSINLFLGSWVSRDSNKYNIPRFFSVISLVLIYFTSLFGLVFYWFIRIFFSKKISFND